MTPFWLVGTLTSSGVVVGDEVAKANVAVEYR
jgi:hypothetical protein